MNPWIVIATVVSGLVCGWIGRSYVADNEIAALKEMRATELKAAADAATAASERARAIEQAANARIQEIAQDAHTRTQAARADAATADRAARLLREHIARLTAGSGTASNPAAADGGETTSGPGLVLAELFVRADDRAGELARFADEAHSAGLACQRAYDSLIQLQATR